MKKIISIVFPIILIAHVGLKVYFNDAFTFDINNKVDLVSLPMQNDGSLQAAVSLEIGSQLLNSKDGLQDGLLSVAHANKAAVTPVLTAYMRSN